MGNAKIKACNEVRNIGAMFDSELSMGPQVKNVCRSAWLHLYNIGKVRSYLNEEQTKTAVHAYVTSKLDGNSSLLAGIPSVLSSQIQRVQNASAKLVTKSKKYDHVTPLLAKLHWLPIKNRIIFKLLLLTYKALNDKGPTYLKDLFTFYKPSLNLRSSSDPLILIVPKTSLKRFGDKSFSVTAAKEWNKMPFNMRSAKSVNQFKSLLKTHLFGRNVEHD